VLGEFQGKSGPQATHNSNIAQAKPEQREL
jgi:hypothetical protein